LSTKFIDNIGNVKAAPHIGRIREGFGFERSEEMKDVAVDTIVVHGVDGEYDEHVGASATGLQASEGPGGNRPYSWLRDYFPRLEGKMARREYYARLEWSSKHSLDGPAVF
jgi:hypothetical protein